MRTDGVIAPLKYWIRFHWSECVLCGKSQSYRERVYARDEPKPEDERPQTLNRSDINDDVIESRGILHGWLFWLWGEYE